MHDAVASSSDSTSDFDFKDETLTISTTLTSMSATSELGHSEEHLDKLIAERHSSVTTTAHHEAEADPEHQGRFRLLLSLLKKFIGVKDIASMRMSLPAQLLEPIGNLEYWNYNDRPDYFVCIGDPDDPLERMLAAIRWWYSKDLKFVKGKLIKPYNSILGEQFSCYWDVKPPQFCPKGNLLRNYGDDSSSCERYRVTCLNEQISHHPPVSAFHYHNHEKGVSAYGIDHIMLRFTGTSVKIGPGDWNKGIYINLAHRDNEEYLMTHPVAAIQGWLKGSLYVVVGEQCVVTCPKTKLKAILEYKEERWLGKPKFAIEGKIFKYDPENDEVKKLKNVNDKDILAEITGTWRGQVYATQVDTKESRILLNMDVIDPIPKAVNPLAEQGPLESRKVWAPVTSAILRKDYSHATREKHAIEERQRQQAAERKARREEFDPIYFKLPVVNGRPELKRAGIERVKMMSGTGDPEL